MNFQELKQYYEMVIDRQRCGAYERAIAQSVAGKVVLDLGSGPGFLSHLALRHGASKVYAIDADAQALGLATELARRFSGPDRFVPVLGYSLDVDLPERVDVIVSEVLDSTGIGENAHVSMEDAVRRFLAPGGRVIPDKLELFVGLGASAESRALGLAWAEVGKEYGLPYGEFDTLLGSVPLTVDCPEVVTGDLVPGQPGWTYWQTVDLSRNDFRRHTVVPLRAMRAGPVRGLATAWRAHLADSVVLESLPGAPATHWKQGFLNFSRAIDAAVGDQFIVELAFAESRQAKVAFEMRVSHARAAERQQFIAGLPPRIRVLVEEGRVGTVVGGQVQ